MTKENINNLILIPLRIKHVFDGLKYKKRSYDRLKVYFDLDFLVNNIFVT